MSIRHDLVDCEIAICTQEVLDHFNDNFDKQNFKDGFVNWLYDSDIIEDRIRAFEVVKQGSYMARISDPRMYGIVQRDILQRKVWPIVVDRKAVDLRADYKFKMNSTYIDKKTQIHI